MRDIVFVDVETTGISAFKDKIIQLSAIRYCGRNEIARFDTYVNPGQAIPSEATEINKITDDIVRNAPKIGDIRNNFLEFIENSFLVGYNTSFDLRFIDIAFDGALAGVKYFDTMALAKRYLVLEDYKLETVARHFDYSPPNGFHNSLTDCEATADIFWKLSAQILLDNCHIYSFNEKKKNRSPRSFSPKDIVPTTEPADIEHPLFGKKIVFTGELTIGRREAAQLAVDVGAIIKSAVSGKTDYLVVGTQDPELVGADGMSGKEEKAHELNTLGKASIKIVSECEFMSLLKRECTA